MEKVAEGATLQSHNCRLHEMEKILPNICPVSYFFPKQLLTAKVQDNTMGQTGIWVHQDCHSSAFFFFFSSGIIGGLVYPSQGLTEVLHNPDLPGKSLTTLPL